MPDDSLIEVGPMIAAPGVKGLGSASRVAGIQVLRKRFLAEPARLQHLQGVGWLLDGRAAVQRLAKEEEVEKRSPRDEMSRRRSAQGARVWASVIGLPP